MTLTKPQQKMIKGKLQIIALRESRLGTSDTTIPVGSIGYVVAVTNCKHPTKPFGPWLVFWPEIKETGAHPKTDLKPTGKRG